MTRRENCLPYNFFYLLLVFSIWRWYKLCTYYSIFKEKCGTQSKAISTNLNLLWRFPHSNLISEDFKNSSVRLINRFVPELLDTENKEYNLKKMYSFPSQQGNMSNFPGRKLLTPNP